MGKLGVGEMGIREMRSPCDSGAAHLEANSCIYMGLLNP